MKFSMALGLSIVALMSGVTAAPTLVLAQPLVQTAPDRCRSDDLVCRIDRLEDRVAELEDRGGDNRGGGGGGRGRNRGVETTVNQTCTFETCGSIATRVCREAGFGRGVATTIDTSGPWQRLEKATCYD